MNSELVQYCDRMVPKDGFRAFIYGDDGESKLVNSWLEFEVHINAGGWHALPSQPKLKEKIKRKGQNVCQL